LIDTNAISEPVKKRPNPRVIKLLDSLPMDSIYISALSLGEIVKGIEKIQGEKKKTLSSWFDKVCSWFDGRVIDADKNIMIEWGKLVVNHNRTLPVIDSILAATCLNRNLVLITGNKKDFEDIDGLTIINPWNNI
jgi:predicted nucleic acid-binding protein